ncbi:Claudin domain-containing protein 1 [Bagarius yarrelli]|uniref:Claudin domain-containing protein 1 n=1 Tax=Bagarius yarrelli TaxID=175774 RepID=A0A556VWB6_BAGYA|nr:Claudin domain-containing protein 1 [Bagarius yarrelli]
MVDNRYATALVIGTVLSLLASVYLSVAVGTQHWYQYRSPPPSNDANNGSDLRELKDDFRSEDLQEIRYSQALFRLNGSLGLWWRCILVPQPDSRMVSECEAFTLAQQFEVKSRQQNYSRSEEDFLRTGLCSLATVCCFLAGVDLLHQVIELPEGVVSSLGWSLYLALVSAPLQMMAAALFIWAARNHRKNYTRMTAYRVA